ncbi:hypothetical protein L537_1119 [Bordetella hinzii 1277]|nr:hypothetical protein L537_1119 [Bordetella hinzii 1277]
MGTTVMLSVLAAVIGFGLWVANNVTRAEGADKPARRD